MEEVYLQLQKYNGVVWKAVEEPEVWAPRPQEQFCWVSLLKCQAVRNVRTQN